MRLFIPFLMGVSVIVSIIVIKENLLKIVMIVSNSFVSRDKLCEVEKNKLRFFYNIKTSMIIFCVIALYFILLFLKFSNNGL